MKKRHGGKRIVLGTVTVEEILKAERKASRESEIKTYGKPISGRKMLHASKKTYNRKKLGKIRRDDDQ